MQKYTCSEYKKRPEGEDAVTMEGLSVSTSSRVEAIDITSKIEAAVKKSKIEEGFCHIFVPHTTAGVLINENADPSVMDDVMAELERLVPTHGNYTHAEGNSGAHIKSSIIGQSVQAMIERSSLKLGRWQGIFFCEFDGPRKRDVWVKPYSR